MNVLVAVGEPQGALIAEGLEREGHVVVGVVAPSSLAAVASDAPTGLDADRVARAIAAAESVVLHADRASLTAPVVGLCDRRGIRIVPLVADGEDERLVQAFGLSGPWPLSIDPWRLSALLTDPEPLLSAPAAIDSPPAKVIAVWGPGGAPGRSTLAIELAVELARGGRRVALVDADSHAPSIALQLGLADEGPGFASACRQAELGTLDANELTRIATPLGRTGVDVLTGLNRPSRWPELSSSRVGAALAVCREWADFTVVDVAAPLERDEEIVSDLDGPRRNAATLAALRAADLVVAVAAADPIGISRLLRAHAELRATIGATPVAVLANRLRPGTLGIDARGQVRRTLERFGGIGDVWFVPADARSADAAILAARPIASVAPRSPLTLALRRFAGEAVDPVGAGATETPRRGIRRLGRDAA